MRTRIKFAVALLAAAALALTGCSSGGSAPKSEKVTLTLWHNYGTTSYAAAAKSLASAYEADHPNVTIKLVSQPGDNYFSLVQASAISKSGPDLAVMWPGLFVLKYKNILTNLKGQIPASSLAAMDDLKWSSDNFDVSRGPYLVPIDKEFYIGFYSKKAFAKAGVTKVPTTWTELRDTCSKLKASGVTPIVYGNGGQSLGAAFYPWYDVSYLMIGKYSLADWQKLYNGGIKWDDPAVVAQFQKWSELGKAGCTNSDVQTKSDNLTDFTTGKAAMIVDGTWDTQAFGDAMKDDLGVFAPPFSDSPIKGVVQFAGNGFSLMKSSTHKREALAFLQFLTTPKAAKIINDSGLIPDRKGETSTNPVNRQMLDFVMKDGFKAYPMLDNVIQPDVVDAGSKVLPPVLGGAASPESALRQLSDAWNHLPADQRGPSYK